MTYCFVRGKRRPASVDATELDRVLFDRNDQEEGFEERRRVDRRGGCAGGRTTVEDN